MNRLGPLDSHQSLIEAAVEIGKPIGVEAHQSQDGCMEVLDVKTIASRS